MKLAHLIASNFIGLDTLDLRIPDVGVTLLVGLNGEGKSSVLEAPSFAFWGKTLRGTTPWRKDTAGSVSVEAAMRGPGGTSLLASRSVTKGGTKSLDVRGTLGDTNQKRQEKLAHMLPSWERWQQTHVFSSTDVLKFSCATDKERKELVESVLGLHIFDRGLELCRADLAKIRQELAEVNADLRFADAEILRKEARVKELEVSLPPLDDEPPPVAPEGFLESAPVDEAALSRAVAEAKAQVEAVPEQAPTLDGALVQATRDARATYDLLCARHDAVQDGECGECGSTFDDVEREKYVQPMAAALLKLREAEAAEKVARAEVYREETRITAERARTYQAWLDAEAALREAQREQRVWDAYKENFAKWGERQVVRRTAREVEEQARRDALQDVRTALATTQLEVETLKASQLRLAQEQEIAEGAERVLGLKGVRVSVLGEALAGVQHVANAWLSRIFPGVTVELRNWTETKAGHLNEQLSLIVHGAGGGYGYKALSSGQRRRIDIALVLGLAEVAAGADGGAGTLFLDEVFDAIDAETAPAIAECLSELGRDRSVVVITHRERELAPYIKAVQRFRVAGGQLNPF